MIRGSKALAWLYLSWPIQAETFPKLHRKAPPPCTEGSYFGPSIAPVYRFTDLWSSFSRLRLPSASPEQRGQSSSTPSTSSPHFFALISKPEALGTYPRRLPLAIKDQRVPTPQPESRENQRQRPSQPLKITPAVLKSGFPSGSEGLWRKQFPLPAGG